MLKYLSVFLGLALAVGAFAAHDNILLYSDNWGTIGDPPFSALSGLGWSCTHHTNGDASGFVSSLNGGTEWDIVVVDNWMYGASGMGTAVASYLPSHSEVTMWFDSYNSSNMSAVASPFEAAIGSTITGDGMGPVYVWDEGNPIFDGVTPNWTNPGVITAGYKLNWATRAGIPILGFTADETAWEAGIVVGNDGRTLLGGYNPTYDPDEAIAIWTNIWEYLDTGGIPMPQPFNLLTPADGEVIDVFTRGEEPGFVAEAMSMKNTGAVTLYNRTSDPVDVEVEFTWEESVNAEEYQILVDDDYTMVSPVVDESGIADLEFTHTFSVDETITYYWRVIASNENGEKQCNDDFSFEFDYNNTSIAPASLGHVKATFR
jgi:hypothetical protein